MDKDTCETVERRKKLISLFQSALVPEHETLGSLGSGWHPVTSTHLSLK
jgi:hypothetical protein